MEKVSVATRENAKMSTPVGIVVLSVPWFLVIHVLPTLPLTENNWIDLLLIYTLS